MSQTVTIANRVGARRVPAHYFKLTADELFQLGFDTFDIAARFSVHESDVLKTLAQQRMERRSKPRMLA